jgi:hypothetical protein
MDKDRKAKMIVRYVDGQSNKIVFSQTVGDLNALKRLEEAMQANCLLLEMEDRVLLIPIHQIKSIEVSPPPDKLPKYAIRGVSIVE